MEFINIEKPILVTGGTGYIASWIIKLLLEKGYTVHTTVRSLKDKKKYSHLTNLNSSKLKFFEADLLIKDSFNEAMKNTELVIHTASPFVVQGIKDANKELIEPAVLGTENVLETANQTPTVKRVVLTSSVAAILGDNKEIEKTKNAIFTEEYWNTTSSLTNSPYSYSKTLAEKKAWEIANKQTKWSLTVINPAFVMGPSLSTRIDSTSIQTILQLSNGTFKLGVPELYFGIVDVRDVALAHVQAGLLESANGRHILCKDSLEMMEIANIIKNKYPSLPTPILKVPYFLIWLVSPILGFTRFWVENNIGYKPIFDNSYTIKDLKMKLRDVKDTIEDHVEQLIKDSLLKL